MNKHKKMILESIWFKRGERQQLVNAVGCNEQDKVFEIMFNIKQRGDL